MVKDNIVDADRVEYVPDESGFIRLSSGEIVRTVEDFDRLFPNGNTELYIMYEDGSHSGKLLIFESDLYDEVVKIVASNGEYKVYVKPNNGGMKR